MKQSILITGIVGSGKSTVAQQLMRQGNNVIELDEIKDLVINLDETLNTDKLTIENQYNWLYDKATLQDIISKQQAEVAFYCGVAGNIDELAKFFTGVILLKSSKTDISERLDERTAAAGLVNQTHDWTLAWKESWESHLEDAGAIVVSTSGDLANTVKEITEKFQKG